MPIRTAQYRKKHESSKIYSNDKLIITPEEWAQDSDLISDTQIDTDFKEQTSLIKVKPSEFVQFAMKLVDNEESTQTFKPFSFDCRKYWIPIYDTEAKRILMKTGRQCEKSTFVGNRILTYCCMHVGFYALYVTPTQQQTKTFRNDRIKGAIDTSDVLKKWINSGVQDNVFLQQFLNLSKITLRYAFLSADRCRGIAGVDCLIIDEVQDIILENIGIIEQTTFAGKNQFKIFIYSGTPKSLDNPIEKYWVEQSTQNEWAIPCWRHSFFSGNKIVKGHWNLITDDANIDPKGLVCSYKDITGKKCNEIINPRDPACHWVSLNPSVLKNENIRNPYEGYHIPQVISPRCDWDKVIQDYHFSPRPQFFNEVLGLSYDSGDKPLTRQDVVDNCAENMSLREESYNEGGVRIYGMNDIMKMVQDKPIYAGIDWSGGSERSYTVLNLASYLQHQGHWFYVPFYWRQFKGPDADPKVQIEKIKEIIAKWKVMFVGCDYGGGYWPNDELTRKFGASRIWKYQYSNPKIKVKWEPGLKRFIVHRSEVMSDIFNAIKRRDIFRFPRWDDFEKPFAEDFLNISSEFNPQRNCIMYQKNINGTDDSLHSLLTGFLASFHQHPRHDVLNFNALTSYSDL